MVTQTDDILRTLHERPVSRPHALDQTERHAELVAVLDRIACALEAQVADQHDQAAFSRLLLKGISPEQADGATFEDYREAPAGFEVLIPGEGWRSATMAEEQEIADMNQKRKRR